MQKGDIKESVAALDEMILKQFRIPSCNTFIVVAKDIPEEIIAELRTTGKVIEKSEKVGE